MHPLLWALLSLVPVWMQKQETQRRGLSVRGNGSTDEKLGWVTEWKRIQGWRSEKQVILKAEDVWNALPTHVTPD